ncbi:methyl-accepting chemotaxis protein [Pseudomonas sp. RIT-PI-AD]|uniref:methyl-accepting chemotaxis protein n=1 Tax=Pseudomonas sp. RIT-PI-AD TaxID=3035294 RepID=UPI0021DB1E41|nr:methyl-accepting chemotaxis protein [Pseudomonas sp. RIT-PI-AD]
MKQSHTDRASWLNNLSVGKKLGFGFGFILLALLLVAAIGAFSAAQLSAQLSKTQLTSTILNHGLEMRLYEVTYASGGDPAALALQAEAARQMDEKIDEGLLRLVRPVSVDLLKRLKVSVDAHHDGFNAQVKARQASADARKPMVRIADQMSATFAALLAKSLEQARQAPDADSVQALATATQLQGLVTEARLLNLPYLSLPSPDNAQAILASLDKLASATQAARASLPAPYGGDLDAAAQAVDGYRTLLQTIFQQDQQLQARGQDLIATTNQNVGMLQALTADQLKGAEERRQQAELELAAVSVLALILGILAAFIAHRQIVPPLRQTVERVRRVAAGDLTGDIHSDRRDELGLLQRSMQEMSRNLRELVGGITHGVTQLSTAAEALSAVSGQTSAGVSQQRSEVDQVATAMNEMASTVQEVARNAEEASRAAQAADDKARRGSAVVGDSVRQTQVLAQDIDQLGEAMVRLTQESEKIGSVVDVIKNVAEQTNLLALNAAIEAARAGEQGRGFAVVADEVRSLAQRTQGSTQEIESLIAALQAGAGEASQLMERSRERTDTTVAFARQTEASLAEINQAVSHIQQMNQQIATAAEEQSAVAEEINRSVVNVRDIADQSATGSEQTAASTLELARLGTQLQTLVTRFKV